MTLPGFHMDMANGGETARVAPVKSPRLPSHSRDDTNSRAQPARSSPLLAPLDAGTAHGPAEIPREIRGCKATLTRIAEDSLEKPAGRLRSSYQRLTWKNLLNSWQIQLFTKIPNHSPATHGASTGGFAAASPDRALLAAASTSNLSGSPNCSRNSEGRGFSRHGDVPSSGVVPGNSEANGIKPMRWLDKLTMVSGQ